MTPRDRQAGDPRPAFARSAAGSPYVPAQNPYINDPPISPGISDDQFDGPVDNPLTRTAPPTTTRPRQQPNGAPADYSVTPGNPGDLVVSPEAAQPLPVTLGGHAMFPIVCRADGTRFQVQAVRHDLACPRCKVGTHLDLDDDLEATARVSPDDPMELTPAGPPEQDQDMALGDPERTQSVPVPEGSAPYSQVALDTPVNASRKTAHQAGDRAKHGSRAVTAAYQMARIGSLVREQNPDLPIAEVRRIAERAVERFPSVVAQTKTAEDALFGRYDSPLLLEPGTKIYIGPLYNGQGKMIEAGYGDKVFEWVGPTRHPYNSVVRELDYGTTWHVNNNRITPVKEATRKTASPSDQCPRCGAHMEDVTVLDGVLRAKCEECGWSGTKRQAARKTAVEDWAAVLDRAVKAGEAAWHTGNPGNIWRPGFVNVLIPGNSALARYVRANNVARWHKGHPSGMAYSVWAPPGITDARVQDGNRKYAYAQAFAGVLNAAGVETTIQAIDD